MAHRYILSSRDRTSQWPRVPDGDAAAVVVLHSQFDASQWLSAQDIQSRQFLQLRALIAHCRATVPHYRTCLDEIGGPDTVPDMDSWRKLPVLTRSALQAAGTQLDSDAPPPAHGRIRTVQSSGSTGKPVRVRTSAVTSIFYYANNMRHARWHRYDPASRYAGITRLSGAQQKLADARLPVAWLKGYVTGPYYHFDVGQPAAAQRAWLQEIQAQILTTYPSNLKNLVDHCQRAGGGMPALRAVTTMSEALAPELRADCEAALGIPIHDIYSAQELGIVALQCPDAPGYHAMAESVLVEILNDDGTPCAPGEIGRVVVTALQNFATPLIRYEVGDYAEAGAPCPCGRGLPMIRRIMGRVRNLLVLPDGKKIWPAFGSRGLTDIAPIRQHQIIQKSATGLEARLVTERPLTADEEKRLARHITARLPVAMSVAFSYHGEIPRSAGGKFEDFISEIDGAGSRAG